MSNVERYVVPRSLEEATEAVAQANALMFAGGTDVLPQARAGIRPFRPVLVNIGRLGALKGISRENGNIRLGALTTITEVLESSLLREHARVLVGAADCFASDQVRNTATLGGNICNASPAGDMIIPLLLLDAGVKLASRVNGTLSHRRLPLCDVFLGPGRTCIEPHEILTDIEFPVPDPAFVAGFRKFGTRPALDIAVVSVGIGGIRENGVLREARVAFGAAAPTPLRGRRTETALEGQSLDEKKITEVAGIARAEVTPISDVRGSAWYRRELVRTLTERLLRHEG